MGKIRVLCYGDSNTWGYIAGTAERREERWTAVCQRILGEDYTVIENGLNGRTTVYDDPFNDYLNGKKSLGYTLISQKPIDLAVVMLGSNDLKYTGAVGAVTGADEIVRMLLNANEIYRVSQPVFPKGAKVLVLAPPLIDPALDTLRPDSTLAGTSAESERFAALYSQMAKNRGAYFLDAALYTKPSDVDCVHIDAESHVRLGKAVAEKILEIFSGE